MKSKKEEWIVKKSDLVYSDPWIRLRVDNVLRPDGFESNYSVAEIKGGVGVVALTEENKIILVGQYRYAPDVYSWEIPKGAFETFKSSDPPLETIKRELKEETGIEANNWEEITMVHTLLGSTDDKVYLFLATNLTRGESHPEKTEKIDLKEVTFEEFYEMVKNQKITDATSIAAVSLAEKMIKPSP